MRRLVGTAVALGALLATGCSSPAHHAAQHTIVIGADNMERTLRGCKFSPTDCTQDQVLFTNVSGDGTGVHPGLIIEFRAPAGWADEPQRNGLLLISRVIAIGGETVKGDVRGHVLISEHGESGPWITLTEPYVYKDGADTHAAFGPVTVPVGRVWVMGDHRNDSADSRFHCGAGGSEGNDGPECDPTASTIPMRDVVAIATRIVSPPSRVRSLAP